jgi:hypothetical protein
MAEVLILPGVAVAYLWITPGVVMETSWRIWSYVRCDRCHGHVGHPGVAVVAVGAGLSTRSQFGCNVYAVLSAERSRTPPGRHAARGRRKCPPALLYSATKAAPALIAGAASKLRSHT